MPAHKIDLADISRHPDALLRLEEAAVVMGTTYGNLKKLRSQGRAPSCVQIPGVGLRCKRATLDQWLQDNAVTA